MPLTAEQIAQFITEGFVTLERAFPLDIGQQCRKELWAATGYDPDTPSTWAQPYIRMESFGTPAFRQAANTPSLHEAFDQLVGAGRWTALTGLGTFPLRFPSRDEPAEAGWHLEAGFAGIGGEPRVNLRSRGRALLMLFLFSDIESDDAPTRIRVGSHLDVPAVLAPFGEDGMTTIELSGVLGDSASRPLALATGRPRRLRLSPLPGSCRPDAPGNIPTLHGPTPVGGSLRPAGRPARWRPLAGRAGDPAGSGPQLTRPR